MPAFRCQRRRCRLIDTLPPRPLRHTPPAFAIFCRSVDYAYAAVRFCAAFRCRFDAFATAFT
jgi:hypothetical protein